MATSGRNGPHHLNLIDRLQKSPEKHHVFQALRIIEAHYKDAPRLGESRRPSEDKVRLAQDVSLAFAPSTLTEFVPPQGKKPGRLQNLFFGFFGPQGPLPLHMTEYARDRLRNHRDPTIVAFANMLTHRLMGLMYRAWSAARPAPSFDRGNDPFEQKVGALAGHMGKGMRDRDNMPDMARRYFAGHLSAGSKTPGGLVAILSAFFEVSVNIQEFVGSWLELEPDDRWQLGQPAGLGQSTSVGSRVWSRAAKFRITIGPLTLKDYERMLPGGDSQKRLEAIVRNYVGDTLDWDVNLILAGEEVPRAVLGGSTRLGHNSWTRARDDTDDTRPDAGDLFLYPRLGTL